MSPVYLWLDDLRKAPDGWLWAKTYDEAVEAVLACEGTWELASLDHDLGFQAFPTMENLYHEPDQPTSYDKSSKEGIDFVKWMIENNKWPEAIAVHSFNPVGTQNMTKAIESFGPYTKKAQVFMPQTEEFATGIPGVFYA